MHLYEHQQKIIDEDPAKAGLFLGTGSGKTRIALLLARGRTLVIAPKTQVEDGNWQREAADIGAPIPVVVSKETFRRDHLQLGCFDTVIVDEAHTCLGVSPTVRYRNKKAIPKASQTFEALNLYLSTTRPKRIYLCTATIMKSPMTVWAAGILLGREWDWYEFRRTYYHQLNMPGRDVWVPRQSDETKERLARTVQKLGYTGRLEDYFDVPEQTFRTVHVALTEAQQERIKELRVEYPDPLVRIGKIHQVENGVLAGDEFTAPEVFENKKIEKILELLQEFPRMVIFCKYRAQMDCLDAALSAKGYRTALLHGQIQNRGGLLSYVNSQSECIFICQAQISAGWEVPDYPVMVFASRTYSFVDYQQALGRVQRANNIKKNLYINLVVKGGVDEAVDKALLNKQSFDERLYVQYDPGGLQERHPEHVR